jgi:uncharacterized protein (TIGR02145 family)
MKTFVWSKKVIRNGWIRTIAALFTLVTILMTGSCNKNDTEFSSDDPSGQLMQKSAEIRPKEAETQEVRKIYFGHRIFKREKGTPALETVVLENPEFNCFDNKMVINLRNGSDARTRVSSAEIKIDGKMVFGPSDFSKKVSFITKEITGLMPESVLEVRLTSGPGSFIDLWIEGTTKVITPVFEQTGPLLLNSEAPDLPAVSVNGISGTWSPGTINTSDDGTFTFIFTPDDGQCATGATMNIMIELSDVEGNVYKTVKIGNQLWMADNLRTTMYRNGELIGTTPAGQDISLESTPKYQWAYDGNESNVPGYGRLYTWYAVNDSRNVCPTGWHVSTDTDWITLADFLISNNYGYEGSGSDIGKSLASATGWAPDPVGGNVGNDITSNNSSGFTAVPAGSRNGNGLFSSLGRYAAWWTSSEKSGMSGVYRDMYSKMNTLNSGGANKKNAASVRCVKNQ